VPFSAQTLDLAPLRVLCASTVVECGNDRSTYRHRSARTGTGVVTTVTPTPHVTLNLFQGPFVLSGSGFDARWTTGAEGWQRQNKFRVTNMGVGRTDIILVFYLRALCASASRKGLTQRRRGRRASTQQ